MPDVAYLDFDAMDRIFKAMAEGEGITLQNDESGEWVHFPADVLAGAEWFVTNTSKIVEQLPMTMPDDQTPEQPAQERYILAPMPGELVDTKEGRYLDRAQVKQRLNALEARIRELNDSSEERWKVAPVFRGWNVWKINEAYRLETLEKAQELARALNALEARAEADRQRIAELERETDAQDTVIQGLKREWRAAEAERDAFRAALERIIDMSPNWMQSDAVADWGDRMQTAANDALLCVKDCL